MIAYTIKVNFYVLTCLDEISINNTYDDDDRKSIFNYN